MKDTFEGTGAQGFDVKAALEKKKKEMLEKAETYKKMYESGK